MENAVIKNKIISDNIEESKELIKKYCPNYKKAEFFVVGSEAMEEGMLEMLKEMRISKRNIFSENFPGY